MAQTREIRRRIKSITNTRKITKAMELVAGAKMRRSVTAVLATRAYAEAAWELLQGLAERVDPALHPLLMKREPVRRLLAVLITSNRGLVGSFNNRVIAALDHYLRQQQAKASAVAVELVLLGKKGEGYARTGGFPTTAAFPKEDVIREVASVLPLARLLLNDFVAGKYDRVVVAYTDFASTLRQNPRVRQLLPIERQDEALGTVGREGQAAQAASVGEYLFEPTPDAVLEIILKRLTEMQVFQAVLESNASEHASRMMAMRSASDAAADLIDDLTLTFNQARQASITREIAEISAGRAAIE